MFIFFIDTLCGHVINDAPVFCCTIKLTFRNQTAIGTLHCCTRGTLCSAGNLRYTGIKVVWLLVVGEHLMKLHVMIEMDENLVDQKNKINELDVM